MATKLSICNDALAQLGEDSISQLTGTTQPEKLCNRFINDAVKEMLCVHDWSFASKRAELAQLVETPLFDWNYQYQLPGDLLKLREVASAIDYTIEGRKLLSNVDSAEIYIRYTYNVTNYNLFDVTFLQAMSFYLAYKIAYPLTQNNEIMQQMFTQYQLYLGQAMNLNSIEADPYDDPIVWSEVGHG